MLFVINHTEKYFIYISDHSVADVIRACQVQKHVYARCLYVAQYAMLEANA